jgi:hypothetical protein
MTEAAVTRAMARPAAPPIQMKTKSSSSRNETFTRMGKPKRVPRRKLANIVANMVQLI